MAGIDVSTSLPRKYEQWSEDVPTAWASPMFTSPFGEGNLISDFQWANPGNNSDEFCRASPHVSLEELGHGLEASDNYTQAGFTTSDNTGPSPGQASELNSFRFDTPAQTTGQFDPPQSNHHHVLMTRKRGSEDEESEVTNCGVGEALYDENVVSPLAETISNYHHHQRLSQSSVATPTVISPGSESSVNWMADSTGTGDQMSPPSPVCSSGGKASSLCNSPPSITKSRRNRERNRVAAHKCRQKAKQSMSDLQIQERELSKHNRMLQDHAGCLRDEILDLKNEILRHSGCDSDIIQNYIARAARDVH